MGSRAQVSASAQVAPLVVALVGCDDEVYARVRRALGSGAVVALVVRVRADIGMSLAALAPRVVLISAQDSTLDPLTVVSAAETSGAAMLALAPNGLDDAVVRLLRAGATDYVPMDAIELELRARVLLAARPSDPSREARIETTVERALRAISGRPTSAGGAPCGGEPTAADIDLARILVRVAARSR